MTSKVIRNNLEIINTFRFDGPHCADERKDADIAICNFINRFLKDYGHLIKMKYPIIIEYNPLDNGYSYLSYQLIKNIAPLTTTKPEFYIYSPNCIITDKSKKKLFPDATVIGSKKLRKIKRGLYVVGHNPLYNNVKFYDRPSKQFTKVYPLERFTPPQINQLFNFYMENKEGYYQIDTNDDLYKFYQYPVGSEKEIEVLVPLCDVILFELSGTDKDFKCYDFILKKDIEENSSAIFLYMVDTKEAAEAIKLNLNPYMNRYHAPNDINIIIGEENTIFHPRYTYSYEEFLEGQG